MFQVQQSTNLLYSDSGRKSVKNTGIRYSASTKYKPIKKIVMRMLYKRLWKSLLFRSPRS